MKISLHLVNFHQEERETPVFGRERFIDLSGQTVRAEVATGELDDYGMWTFFKIDTINGGVTIRFNGESEYYSVDVDCFKLDFRKEILSEKINIF